MSQIGWYIRREHGWINSIKNHVALSSQCGAKLLPLPLGWSHNCIGLKQFKSEALISQQHRKTCFQGVRDMNIASIKIKIFRMKVKPPFAISYELCLWEQIL